MEHIRGNPRAAVTLLEFGDFECSYCGEAYPVVRELENHFGREMNLRFRHFPLTQMHPHAMHAARAAESAGQQGMFWGMHDLLFQNQEALRDRDLMKYAEELSLDLKRFSRDFESEEIAQAVLKDLRDGENYGVEGTPTFFINEDLYEGPVEFEPMRQAIQHAIDEEMIRLAI